MLTRQSPVHRLVKALVPSSSQFLQVSLPLGVLLLGCLLTDAAWRYTEQETQQNALQTFEQHTQRTKASIERRLQTYFDALRAGQGFFAARQTTKRAEWQAFVQAMDLPKRYPGINGLGFIRSVADEQKTLYESQVRHDTSVAHHGYPNFAVRLRAGVQLILSLSILNQCQPMLQRWGWMSKLNQDDEQRPNEHAIRAR